MHTYKNEWNKSYKNKDNFVFYPHEDIIRFISKYIRKRIGLNEFEEHNSHKTNPKVLDFGCGIGRHIKLLEEFKLDGYGFDLSQEAIDIAKYNFKKLGLEKLADKVIVSDITKLPYKDKYFHFMFSHGVLDSMPFEIAKKGMVELNRILKTDGLMYFDLISTDDSSFDNSDNFERIVTQKHEKGTVQTYFDTTKIEELIDPFFEIIELYKIKKEDLFNHGLVISRLHVIVRKKK